MLNGRKVLHQLQFSFIISIFWHNVNKGFTIRWFTFGFVWSAAMPDEIGDVLLFVVAQNFTNWGRKATLLRFNAKITTVAIMHKSFLLFWSKKSQKLSENLFKTKTFKTGYVIIRTDECQCEQNSLTFFL